MNFYETGLVAECSTAVLCVTIYLLYVCVMCSEYTTFTCSLFGCMYHSCLDTATAGTFSAFILCVDS